MFASCRQCGFLSSFHHGTLDLDCRLTYSSAGCRALSGSNAFPQPGSSRRARRNLIPLKYGLLSNPSRYLITMTAGLSLHQRRFVQRNPDDYRTTQSTAAVTVHSNQYSSRDFLRGTSFSPDEQYAKRERTTIVPFPSLAGHHGY